MRIISFIIGLTVAAEWAGSRALVTGQEEQACKPCEPLFSQVSVMPDGSRVQNVEVQVRGEPKSGTSFMFKWAGQALETACEYLNLFYGKTSCLIEDANVPGKPGHLGKKTLVFTPGTGIRGALCTCAHVDRVEISISTAGKHSLPVEKGCSWDHPDSVARGDTGCKHIQGRPVENYHDLWQCMGESPCRIVDDRLQMVVLRDPRPVTVSCYFHQMIYFKVNDGTIDDYMLQMLPTIAQWFTIRYYVFKRMMPRRSAIFWYDDAINDPVAWHYRWYEAVGLHLPDTVVQRAAFASAGDGASNYRMPHPGGAQATTNRSFKQEISPELHEKVDEILRLWLPPELLEKVGV